MKRLFVSVVLFIFLKGMVAQSFDKDTVHFNVCAGFGWPYEFDKSYTSIWSLPAFSAQVERGVYTFDSLGTISIGLSGTYKYLENKRLNTVAVWNNYVVGALVKFNFHFLNSYRLIPYAGLYGGINAIKFSDNFFTHSSEYPVDYNGVFPLTYVFAGVKYMSTKNFGIYAEGSYGFSWISFGLYKVL